MTKEEAIKFLQQLYPNGGHCWLDEQRIEAIGMAIQALQEEPISEDVEEVAKHYLYSNILYDDVYVGNPTEKDCIEMFRAGAKWKKEQLMAKAIDTKASFTMSVPSICISLPLGVNVGDKVKIIVIKED